MFRLLEARSAVPEPAFTSEDLTRLALTVGGVVAYSRPFKKSRGADAKRLLELSDLEHDLLAPFSVDSKDLHDELLSERDRISAHSDSELWDFQIRSDPTHGPTPRVTVPRRAFTGAFLTRIVRHCHDMHMRVGQAALRLNPAGIIDSMYLAPRAS